MPTASEYIALSEAVTSDWTDDYQGSGVAGLVFTSTADSSKKLFFPACGYAYEGSVVDASSEGGYWSSSLCSDSGVDTAYGLYINS